MSRDLTCVKDITVTTDGQSHTFSIVNLFKTRYDKHEMEINGLDNGQIHSLLSDGLLKFKIQTAYHDFTVLDQHEPDDNFDRRTMQRLFEFFADGLFLYIEFLRRITTDVTQQLFGNLRLPTFFERVSDEVSQLQAVRYIGFITALSCAIPFVLFIMFGITSVIITFGGFLFVEGVLLAFGGLCMVACIAALMSVLSVLALTLGAIYMVGLKLGYLMRNFEPTSNILRAIAPSIENVNGGISHAHQS